MNHICFNGEILPAEEPVLLASNRGYRYGDGLFETMKLVNGEINLVSFHFERLFEGLSLLKFERPLHFTQEKILQDIRELCKKDGMESLARVRLSVFRGNGGLYDDNRGLQWIIECWPIDPHSYRDGIIIDIYPGAQKTMDSFSNLKSANFLPYTMAALFAKEKGQDDSIVLNTAGRIADSTIANVFIIKDGKISTPALSEGCVNGVMRRWLIEKLPDAGHPVLETSLTIADLENANEVFLTNAVRGICRVNQFRDKKYSGSVIARIDDQFIKMISR